MFEAIHGSAPRRAGQNLANPSGLLQGAIMMLNHIGQSDVAEKVQNAWLKTIEDGIHTYDIYKEGVSKLKVGTKEFAQAVIARLGQKPTVFPTVRYDKNIPMVLPKYQKKEPAKKDLVGVDIFVHWNGTNPDELAGSVQKMNFADIKLSMITNRGIKVWPEGFEETFCTDHWRCRFKRSDGGFISKTEIIELLTIASQQDIDVIKTENLYFFDGVQGYSLGQGQ
jgi:isocitrate dehydrogenase